MVRASWPQARAICQAKGRELPIIKQPRLSGDFDKLHSGASWLGLRRGSMIDVIYRFNTNRTWQWANGNMVCLGDGRRYSNVI